MGAVTYPTGHVDTIEVAVRRAVVTGVNQTALKLQWSAADQMECDLVEVTAHAGARPEHAIWQGGIYSRSGQSDKYPDFVQSTGYGTGAGLGGWNCRHSFFPYFEGSPRSYTPQMLEQFDAKDYNYGGRKMTEYEASQQQRYIERQIRRWKREGVAMQAAGLPTDEAAAKVSTWQKTQAEFLKQTGLKRQVDRLGIGGKIDKLAASKKAFTPITDTAINKVSKLSIHGLNDEQSAVVQQQHRELLETARNKNDSKEVAFIFGHDFKQKVVQMGNRSDLSFTDGDSVNILSKQNNLFVMHNHPGNSGFSMADLSFFIGNDGIKHISVVRSIGTVEVLTKSENFDKIQVQTQMRRLYKKHVKRGSAVEYDKLIAEFLSKNGGGIIHDRD